jgi:2-pyrone-4,6-dicarboxylate lactonase
MSEFAFAERGVCDAHCHIVGPAERFPLVDGASGYHPKEALFALHRQLGVERSVIVQSARHGLDNSAVEDAIRSGERRYLGVAIVGVDTSDDELARLVRVGFRGVRFNFMRHLHAAEPIEAVIEMTPRLARAGLHLQVHFESDLIHPLGPHLKRSHVPVVIDHLGRVDASRGASHADFAALTHLLQDERFHVKVSGVDRIDRGPPYPAGIELARLLVRSFPGRCFWGTDWPHLNHHHQADDATLAKLTALIAPDSELRHRLLVTNPETFYRFESLEAR